jgi:hypothetical protein
MAILESSIMFVFRWLSLADANKLRSANAAVEIAAPVSAASFKNSRRVVWFTDDLPAEAAMFKLACY